MKTTTVKVNCPICECKDQKILYRNKRIADSLGEVKIYVSQCKRCKFIFNSPRITNEKLTQYYKSDSLASGSVYSDLNPDGHYPKLHRKRISFFTQLIDLKKKGLLLDVGCGSGKFLDVINNKLNNWECIGVDPSIKAIDACKKKGLNTKKGTLDRLDFNNKSIDVISFISVLEHLTNPVKEIQNASLLIKENGQLFIEVPNLLEPELALTSCFSIEHIVHFTPFTLCRLLEQCGFKFVMRDFEAVGVIRLIASKNYMKGLIKISDINNEDSEKALKAISNITEQEKKLLSKINTEVTRSLDSWNDKGLRIAIYGAGVHSEFLETLVGFKNKTYCFIDGDKHKQGKIFLGLPVIAPEEILDQKIEAILISSHRFVDEMINKVKSIAGDKIEIQTCYE